MVFDPNKAWIGIGSKVGGMLIGAGLEHTRGVIARSTNLSLPFDFSLTSARLGLGIGFSGGVVIMMVFNCNNIHELHNKTEDDWGVTVAAGGRWAAVVRSIRQSGTFARAATLGWRARGVFGTGEDIRNVLHEAYSLYDIRRTGDQRNKLIVIDTPLGTGAELAVNISTGLVRIG
jgi:hypothetical protein